jgi:hypothetical protein
MATQPSYRVPGITILYCIQVAPLHAGAPGPWCIHGVTDDGHEITDEGAATREAAVYGLWRSARRWGASLYPEEPS